MNRTKLKNYAPQARRDFIQAMTDRAAYFGLTATKIEPVVEKGDVAVIGGRSFPRAVAKKRKALEDRIKRHGFEQTMEAMAYTWFNRLVAIRFMELHGYLDHGYRVLSHPEGKPTPEILEHAEHVDMPGLKKEAAIDLKLAGNKESELYRLLLTAQCNALHSAMPFLFEKIDDETELLLPDNLLHSDSLIRKLVGEIDEEDWQEVEIIGWLYQFYISERKDEVIGKVVASEDIPAATQLFTPNWIVKYLVQNTLGRQWLATYPQSALRQQMEYYIEPAEQTPEVQEQLKAITPTSLNPEELTLLDPACGSGHILVEAYDLFKAIYQERGYRAKDIPALILNKNLFGLEIDDRAAQLAAFALMMKARADDRRIFESGTKPNVVAFQETTDLDADHITKALNEPVMTVELPPSGKLFEDGSEGLFSKENLAVAGDVRKEDIAAFVELFRYAKTFGSLIQIPPKLAAKLPGIEDRTRLIAAKSDTFSRDTAARFLPLLQQTRLLTRQYDAVVANPPYMGPKAMPLVLREFARACYKRCKPDVYAMFVEKALFFAGDNGFVGMITMHNWMFLASFEEFRSHLLSTCLVVDLAHLGPRAFDSISGEVVNTAAYILRAFASSSYRGSYHRLLDLSSQDKSAAIVNRSRLFVGPCQANYVLIPGSPVAYWISDSLRAAFATATVESITISDGQNKTADNDRFVRCWWEVAFSTYGRGNKWLPYAKGGDFRKWFGNLDFVVDWSDDARAHYRKDGNCRIVPDYLWYKPGVTWSRISGGTAGFRLLPHDSTFDMVGSSVFAKDEADIPLLLALLNSPVASAVLSLLNPTLDIQIRDVRNVPLLVPSKRPLVDTEARRLIDFAKKDWHSQETSVEYIQSPLAASRSVSSVEESLRLACHAYLARLEQMKAGEEALNSLFIDAYGLQDELSPEVPDDQITLYRPDREEDTKRLISYGVGCMMGRYSLDKPGLVYARSGNQDFDANQYKTFRADDDGIIPLLETDWGIRDDATNRFVEFIGVAWPKDHLEENLKFVADSLGPNNSEQPRDTIRRYLATGFYKHHLSMYKKRPIYWLFSSGKLRAFQCLVYLHRYHEGTLARMRTEYVIPLQGQIAARIEQLEGDKAKATSTSHRKKLQKEQDDLKKQETELRTFEEKLKHAADQKIRLDLDDGVKVNYAKFGDLLAESKAITGGKDDE